MPEIKFGFNDTPQISGSLLLAQFGPTFKVNIGFDSKFRPDTKTMPVAGISDIDALVDTGSAECCIDNLLAASLKLPVMDRRQISGIGGKHMTNTYLAQIHVPSLNFTIYGAFAGVALRAGGQKHDALMGRTFLQLFTMVYEGKIGKVTLTS